MKNKFAAAAVFSAAQFFIAAFAVFPDPYSKGITFEEAGQLAVAASHDLQSEYAFRALKEGAWVLGRRAYLPKLTLSAYEDERLSKFGADSFLKNYSVGIEQLVFDGGRLYSSRKIEKAHLALESQNLQRKATEISEAAILVYRQILTSRAMLKIQEAGLVSLEDQRRILASEVQLGLVLQSDLAQADISIRESRIEILSLQIEIEETEKQFVEALGLTKMPPLLETIDVQHSAVLPPVQSARYAAQSRNPELLVAQLSIKEKQEQTKYLALSWIPTLSANGSFVLSGNKYPLTHYTWSFGLNIQFASPWISSKSGASAGFEDRNEQNFRMQGSVEPLPDPAASLNYNQAKVALALEKTNYDIKFERLGRAATMAVEKCGYVDQKRILALESQALAAEKLELIKLKRKLGLITAMELVDAQIEYTKKEIEVVQAAANVLAAERELEKLMDLQPGELRQFAASQKLFSKNF